MRFGLPRKFLGNATSKCGSRSCGVVGRALGPNVKRIIIVEVEMHSNQKGWKGGETFFKTSVPGEEETTQRVGKRRKHGGDLETTFHM